MHWAISIVYNAGGDTINKGEYMRISRGVRPQKKVWTWVCVALLFLLVACGANTSQENKNSVFQIPAQNQDGSPVGSSSPIGLQLSPHSGKSGTPTKTT